MNKKHIRQMTGSLLRRTAAQPAAKYLAPHRALVRRWLEEEDLLQRFAPLFDGTRLSCAAVLSLCREELERLSPRPEEGWLAYAYGFARGGLFPEQFPDPGREVYGAGASFFLALLQVLFDAERAVLPMDPMWDLDLLREEELEGSAHQDGYRLFLRACRKEYVYELMRLGLEVTPWRTLEHIAGVHHVAVSVARDLKRAGVPIDLPLVSAAAAGHDIGKFGCRPGERVPYLHYYYTDLWFRSRHMEDVGYVAANHSVWDLELDYLSAESLALIYADFRVKQDRGSDGREVTRISTLTDAFDVILHKLDNVTNEKRTRYTFVYTKLRDFERYMVRMGVDVTLSGRAGAPLPQPDAALMEPAQAMEALRMLGVEHNVALMSRLTGQRSFAGLLEQARGETDWRRLRACLGVLESYSVYLGYAQKVQTLAFLYELLMHREGDIRRQSAALMGEIIARFHAGYVKESPDGCAPDGREEAGLVQWRLYLAKLIRPDRKLMAQHRRWIGFTLKMVVNSVLEKCPADRRGLFLQEFLRYYRRPERLEDETAFQLLETATALPVEVLADRQRYDLLFFAQALSSRKDVTVRTAAVLLLDYLRPAISTQDVLLGALREVDCAGCPSLALLREEAMGEITGRGKPPALPREAVSEIFLDNLKAATPWILKEVNIRLLTRLAREGDGSLLHIATHLTNLVKVSDRVTVRHAAGAALLSMAPLLSAEERNEVAVELCRGLEIGQQEFAKYIPGYLGRFCLWLPPVQLDEVLSELEESLCASNARVASAALDAVGVIYEEYDTYRVRFPEGDAAYRRRRERLLGLLLRGLAGFRPQVRQEALFVLGRHVFGSEVLGVHEKRRAFLLTQKRLLSLLQQEQGDELTFYYRAAMLGRLYRFLTEQELLRGGFRFEAPRPVAFFPGTFDPFTLSHKGIVHAIRDLGFEVYLAVDEFSWSKKAQPHLIRRQIVNLSVAGDFHVHLFPDDIPVNIANPADLERLVGLFPGQKVYLVAGSDVVANASSYKAEPQPFSIHHMNHVIFRRAGEAELPAPLPITGDVIQLQLPPHLEDISSTRIRENVDLNRDISNFIDPVIQDFIYQNGLYLRDSQDKPMLGSGELDFQWEDEMTSGLFDLLSAAWPEQAGGIAAARSQNDKLLLLRGAHDANPLGFLSYRLLSASQLFDALGDNELADRIRLRSAGDVLLITALGADYSSEQRKDLGHLLLCELIACALEKECVYAVCKPRSGHLDGELDALLSRMGFVAREGDAPIREVDMRAPTVLIQNLSTAIQEPLNRNPRVLSAVRRGHERVQLALAGLFPGSLVLTLSSDIIHHRLLKKITEYNQVPAEPTSPRVLGKSMCVPFGKMLRSRIVPNTVTKTLHTDKVYTPDLSESTLEAFPYYAPIPSQVRTLKSFDRPVILVDDLMHPGFRFKALGPILRQEGVPVQVVLVGVLSGYGKDLMRTWDQPVDAVYFLPRLNHWFVESTMYPFIGGNTVRRPSSPVPGLLPGINHILPYAAPTYQKECGREAVVRLSRTCLECALDLMQVLEQEYRILYGRNLTLSRLPEAIILPLCPDKGTCLHYDATLSASVYLENDLEVLLRQNQ